MKYTLKSFNRLFNERPKNDVLLYVCYLKNALDNTLRFSVFVARMKLN